MTQRDWQVIFQRIPNTRRSPAPVPVASVQLLTLTSGGLFSLVIANSLQRLFHQDGRGVPTEMQTNRYTSGATSGAGQLRVDTHFCSHMFKESSTGERPSEF